MGKLEGDKRRKNLVLQRIKINTGNPEILNKAIKIFLEQKLGVTLKVKSTENVDSKHI